LDARTLRRVRAWLVYANTNNNTNNYNIQLEKRSPTTLDGLDEVRRRAKQKKNENR